MKTLTPYAKMLSNTPSISDTGFSPFHGIELLKKIEWCGRISHRSEDAQTDTSYERFIKAVVIGKGDWSIVEHASVSVEAVVDRGITHEWVRHRLGAYTQESTRFVNYETKMLPSFVVPDLDSSRQPEAWGHISLNELKHRRKTVWLQAIESVESAYAQLVTMGISPQLARSVFPNALAAKIIITYNLRMWRHFLIMRTTAEAHPQMKEVTIPLLGEFQKYIPILYDDIIPNESQSKALAKVR